VLLRANKHLIGQAGNVRAQPARFTPFEAWLAITRPRWGSTTLAFHSWRLLKLNVYARKSRKRKRFSEMLASPRTSLRCQLSGEERAKNSRVIISWLIICRQKKLEAQFASANTVSTRRLGDWRRPCWSEKLSSKISSKRAKIHRWSPSLARKPQRSTTRRLEAKLLSLTMMTQTARRSAAGRNVTMIIRKRLTSRSEALAAKAAPVVRPLHQKSSKKTKPHQKRKRKTKSQLIAIRQSLKKT